MSLSIGIVGLPNVGKSTLFNALTDNDILAANYPFATIEPNTGIVPIPDQRLDSLQKLYPSAKKIPATVTFVDIAGLVAGASQGEGLGNKFLANIRECAAICHVVRAFNEGDVVHVADRVDPKADIDIIETELILADLDTVEKRILKLNKEARANPKLKPQADAVQTVKEALESGTAARNVNVKAEYIADLHLLSAKVVIYVFNIDEADLTNDSVKSNLQTIAGESLAIFINAKSEAELRGMNPSEKQDMLDMLGQAEPGLDLLIKAAYQTLGLQSYLTAGDKEVRAWTIRKDATAPQAAGVIHGDFERGFIAADIVEFKDLIAATSWPKARTGGKVRTEGKTYVVQPNDVVEFKFNV